MQPPSTPVAAFCARGREIGYVLMTGGRIMRYGVKTIKGKRQGREFYQRVARALMAVLERLTPRCLVVVENMPPRGKPGAVNQAIRMTMQAWEIEKRHRIRAISLKKAKRRICGQPTATHRDLAKRIIIRHPILSDLRCVLAAYRPLYWELVCMAAALAETPAGP
jgi:hypothetical protein